jgi:hypothetical protein
MRVYNVSYSFPKASQFFLLTTWFELWGELCRHSRVAVIFYYYFASNRSESNHSFFLSTTETTQFSSNSVAHTNFSHSHFGINVDHNTHSKMVTNHSYTYSFFLFFWHKLKIQLQSHQQFW